jgi:hypothetical protein
MEKLKPNNTFIITIVILLLYIPFFESYSSSTLWGLKWHSPEMMDKINTYFRPLKLMLVVIGVTLLLKSSKKLKAGKLPKILNGVFTYSSYFIGFIQIILLSIGLLFSSLLSSNLSYIHKEKRFDDQSIYVYTADPGAMGTAYHYFYLKCKLPFNRFTLQKISKLEWMREFNFDIKESELIINHLAPKETIEHRFDISNVKCES